MTSRPRPRNQSNKPVVPADQVQRDLERFAAALKASEQADKAARNRAREQQAAEATLADAKRALERAVEGVRSAKAARRGVAEADATWKAAKALVIELETGVRPAWAPAPPAVEVESDAPEESGDESGDDSGVEDQAGADTGDAVGE